MSDSANTKICGCEQGTFVKCINMGVGLGMVFFGFFNMLSYLTIGKNIVLDF